MPRERESEIETATATGGARPNYVVRRAEAFMTPDERRERRELRLKALEAIVGQEGGDDMPPAA
jgi:hypothetical protein